MKKIGLIILAAFFTYAATAQTDIKVFDKIGPDAVLNKLCELNFFQEPEYFSSLHWTKSENGLVLENEKGGVLNPSVALADNTYELIGFETTSDRFLFLTDYIPGGIKVGDSISKVQNVSFSDTEYGKGNPKNNCTKVFSSPRRRDLPDLRSRTVQLYPERPKSNDHRDQLLHETRRALRRI